MSRNLAAGAAQPAACGQAGSLLWRALVALTLLLTSCQRLEGAGQRDEPPASQEEALLQLKAAFPGWSTTVAEHRLQGWEPAAAGSSGAGSSGGAAGTGGPCSWSFVGCDADGHVVKLELSPAALRELSPEPCDSTDEAQCRVQLPAPLADLTLPLSRLPALRQLTLSGLGLTGSLPPEWPTALPALQTLDLSGNALTGGLPAAWIAPGAWQSLAALDLSHNPLGGSLPSVLPAGLNGTALRAAVQSWIDRSQPATLLLPPPPLRKLLLSGCQLSGSLPWDWALLDGLMLLWLDDNQLAGTMPPAWGRPNRGAKAVEDLTLWADGMSLAVQRNQLHGRAACCETRMIVQPGNDRLCLPVPGTNRVELQRGTNVGGGFNQQVCSAGERQATYCSTQPAEMPVCEEPTAGQHLRLAGRKGGDRGNSSAVAGGLAAAAGGVLAVAAAAAAVGLRRRQSRRQQRAAQLPSALWDGELANLLPRSGVQLQHHDSAAAASDGSKPPSSGGSSDMAAGKASSESGSGERRGPRSSWRLHSRSLQLQANDFQIQLDKFGRPDLLGAGASAKVYRGLLYGTQPVAIKVLAPAAACKLLDPSPRASLDAPDGAGGEPQEEGQQQPGQLDPAQAHRQHERRMWREVELLRQCRHPNLVQLLGVYVSPAGAPSVPAQQQRRLMIVTELLEGGSLAGRLGEAEMRWHRCGGRVALDVARGLAFLHQLGIAHRDVKSGNVLLTAKSLAGFQPQQDTGNTGGSSGSSLQGNATVQLGSTAAPPEGSAMPLEHSAAAGGGGDSRPEAAAAPLAKLGDVGLARALDQASMSLIAGGTILYAAPEQLANSAPSLAADMFSLAWVIHEIATGERLLRRGQGRPLRAPEDCPAAIVQLVERCLHVDPSARPTAAEAVEVIAASVAAAQPP